MVTVTPKPTDRLEALRAHFRGLAWFCVRLLVIGVTAYLGWVLLRTFWNGVLPIILALILTTVLWPPTAWLRQHHVPGALAALGTLAGSAAIAAGGIAAMAPSVASQSQILYFQTFGAIQRVQLWLQGPPLNLDDRDLDQALQKVITWLQEQSGRIAGSLFSGISAFSSVLVTLGIVVVLTFFFLKDGERFLPWLRGITGRRAGDHAAELLHRCWRTLGGFMRAQAVVSLVDAIFIGLGLVIVGVPLAVPLATLTFLAGFIPIVGAFVAGTVAVLVAFVSLGLTQAIIVLVIILLVQQLEGNILSPLLQSKAMNLHPVVVLVSVTVGGGLFGIVGAFLAVPTAAMVAVCFRYVIEQLPPEVPNRGFARKFEH